MTAVPADVLQGRAPATGAVLLQVGAPVLCQPPMGTTRELARIPSTQFHRPAYQARSTPGVLTMTPKAPSGSIVTSASSKPSHTPSLGNHALYMLSLMEKSRQSKCTPGC